MHNWWLKIMIPTVLAFGLVPIWESEARPAAVQVFSIVQPDGTVFSARLRGDEFMKIFTTTDGHAIGQDADGWFCYAYYAEDGTKTLTEFRIGQDVPAEVLAQSSQIPYEALLTAASEARKSVSENTSDESPLARIRAARGIRTRNDGSEVIEKHGIVILAQFADLTFQSGHTKESFEALLTQEGYSLNGATGSAKDYFNEQFDGQFSFSFDVSDIVTLSKSYSYYGRNTGSDSQDENPAEMVKEACELADSQIDFSKYDDDGDGEVDNVFVFYAGADEAEGAGDNHIWSHAWYVKDGANIDVTLDGKIINRYACTSELSRMSDGRTYSLTGIGTFCHEFSHTLGLSDYYDTDYQASGGKSMALWGSTALMDSGNSNNGGNTPPNLNAAERDELGIYEPEMLTEGTHVLEPINENGRYYKMETGNEGEYYLFECRAEEGWDKYIGGSGLLVYHIDKSGNRVFSGTHGNVSAKKMWEYNEVNCNPSHQCADLVEALTSAGDVSQVFFPYSTGSVEINSFTPLTDPAFVFWNMEESPLAITGIEREGNNIVLTVNAFSGEIQSPVNIKSQIYQDAVIITWEAPAGYNGKGFVRWKKSSGSEEFTIAETDPYETGKYSCTIEGLEPLTPYKCEIYFEADGVESKASACNFTTKSPRDQSYPFIYLYYVEKNDDGSFQAGSKFPLRLYNAYNAEEIIWYMDGEQISTDGSGFYIPRSSGEMKAEIRYKDGSTSIVTRTITIK